MKSSSTPFARVFIGFSLLVASLVLSSCNVINIRRGQIEDSLKKSGLTHNVAQIAEAKVSFWVGGEGPTVLLLHGFGASAIWQWYEQVEALAPHFRVIVPDLIWFGGSSSEVRDFSIDRRVEVMKALADHLEVDKMRVVGISYGGLVAYQLASALPERVDKVVISDSPGRVYTRDDYRLLCERFGVNDIADVLIPKNTDDVERLMEIAYFDPPFTPRFARKDALESLYADYRDEQARLLKTAVDDMEEIRAAPDAYKAKTLIVWGREDQVFPLEIGERLAKYLGDKATLLVIDRARHAPNLEHPELFNKAVLDFLVD